MHSLASVSNVNDQVIGLVIAACSLAFIMASAILGVALRAIVKVTRMETSIESLVKSKDETHSAMVSSITGIADQLREDRNANNAKFIDQERRIWEMHDAIRSPPGRR